MTVQRGWRRALLGMAAMVAASCGDNTQPVGSDASHPGGGDSAMAMNDLAGGGGDLAGMMGNGDLTVSMADLMAAPPDTTIPTSTIDFGLANCGGNTPAPQTLSFTNSGGSPLTYTANIPPGGAFSLTGADGNGNLSGTVAPGMTGMITITTVPVPSSAVTGMPITGQLTITTNVPNSSSTIIPLQVEPQGATLVVSPAVTMANPANANFGQAPLNMAAPTIPLMITNTGNASVTFTVGVATDPQFGVTGASGAITLAAGATAPSLAATFKPTSLNPSTATSVITVGTGAICGMSANTITYAGQGTGSMVTSTPGNGGTLSFGSQNCGAKSIAGQMIALANSGNTAYAFTATLGAGAMSPFKLSAATGSVPAATGNTPGSATVTVTPNDVSTMATPGASTDTLTIAPPSGQPGASITINVSLTVTGAVLAFGTTPGAFQNASSGGGSQTQSLVVTNTGNAPASPTLTVGTQSAAYGPFAMSSALSDPITGGSMSSAQVTFTPKAGDYNTDTASLTLAAGAGDVICGALPAALTLTGTGQSGGFQASTSAINFGNNGNVACTAVGAQAAAQTFTISNIGNAPFNWSAGLGKTPSPFSVSPTMGILQPNSMVTITVTPGKIPFPATTTANFYGDTLTIQTTINGDTGHTIALNQTALGAILAFNPATTIDFGNVPISTSVTSQLAVVNSGSAPANVTITESTTSGVGTFTINSSTALTITGLKGGGGSSTVTAGFAPGSTPTASTGQLALTIDNATLLCAPLPSALPMQGTGTQAKVTVNPSTGIVFTGGATTQGGTNFNAPPSGNTYCGTTAAAQTITFGNVGTQAYTINAVTFGLGNASQYTYTINNDSGKGVGVVPVGGTDTVTITSAKVPATYSFLSPAVNFTDTVTIGTDAAGDSPHQLNITQSPYGAVLTQFSPPPNGNGVSAFAFNNTPGGGQGVIPMGIANVGNVSATVAFTVTSSGNAPNGTWSFDTATVGANAGLPSGGTNFNAYFNPPKVMQNTAYSGATATFGVTNTPLCAALPIKSTTMTGTATTGAAITVTPANIAFANILCGATLPNGTMPQTVTITNQTGSSLPWTASIPNNPDGSSFMLSAPSGTVGANSTSTFTIMPAPIKPSGTVTTVGNQDAQTLTVTVGTGGSAQTFTINVTETAKGAELQWANANLTSPDENGGGPTTTNSKLENFGNLAVNVTLTLGNITGAGVVLGLDKAGQTTASGAIQQVGQGGVATGFPYSIINSSPKGKMGTATVTVTTTDVICNPLPNPVNVTAK